MPRESTRTPPLILALLAAAVALAACGGDSSDDTSDEDRIRERISSLADAVAARDAAGFCEHVDLSELPEDAECEPLAEEELSDRTGDEQLAAETLEIREVEIEGDEATARVATDAEEDAGTIDLRRVDDDWKVSYLGVLE